MARVAIRLSERNLMVLAKGARRQHAPRPVQGPKVWTLGDPFDSSIADPDSIDCLPTQDCAPVKDNAQKSFQL